MMHRRQPFVWLTVVLVVALLPLAALCQDPGQVDVSHRSDVNYQAYSIPEYPSDTAEDPTATPSVTATATATPDLATATPTATPSTPTETPVPSTPTPAKNCLYVPYEFPSIQIAIDAAEDGDTVMVAPGEYRGSSNTDLKFGGRAIHLTSFPGEPTPVIDCMGTDSNYHQGFIFNSQDGPGLQVSNIAVINGFYGLGGGMWFLPGSAPIIRNCLIRNCVAEWSGGGIQAFSSGVILNRVTIEKCQSIDGGGSAACFQGGHADYRPIMYRCRVSDNQTFSSNFGVVQVDSGSEPIFTSCEFFRNSRSAMWFDSGQLYELDVNNCLFVGNDMGITIQTGTAKIDATTFNDQLTYAVSAYEGLSKVHLVRCCLWGENDLSHNISSAMYCNMPDPDQPGAKRCFFADPRFSQGAMGDYYLFQSNEDEPFSPNYNTGGSPVWLVQFPGPGYSVSMENMTTAVTHQPDERFADVGYHYTLYDGEPTPQPPPERPVIEEILGCTDDFSSNMEMAFMISALVQQPPDGEAVDTVELFWNNFPIEIELVDDGTCGDAVAGDNRYSRNLTFYPNQLPDYEYEMYVVATDTEGDMSIRMPYVISVENPNKTRKTTADAGGPVLAGRYVWYHPVTPGEDEDGWLWILARVEHPDGLNEMSEVRVLLDGVDTGLRLKDVGGGFDLDENDGYYGAYLEYNGADITDPVSVILDVQAVDVNGVESRTWPVAWQTRSYFEE